MIETISNEVLHRLTAVLEQNIPSGWGDIARILDQIKNRVEHKPFSTAEDPLKYFAQGTAFITFAYGIDGVSIEIMKYAHALQDLFMPSGESNIHMIGGDFHPESSMILRDDWQRLRIEGINGWDKWEDGKWFEALFEKKMNPRSEESIALAQEIYSQAVSIATQIGNYLVDRNISLLIPVNIASNPGNLALTLGLVFATEGLGTYVLNSNHDFYWESGKPEEERLPDEKPGIRDHFFRNINNKSFFKLFQSLYPWNGKRWLQVNINARQSRRLVKRYGFQRDSVSEISTCVGDQFFEPYDKQDVKHARLRMAHILSDGEAILHPIPIKDFLNEVSDWMIAKRPVILSARPGLEVDPQSEGLIYLLQPTRVIYRKRIEKDIALIKALLKRSALRKEFERNPDRQIILHITGPTPMEHQQDLEKVLNSYQNLTLSLPEEISNRVFLAFSIGQENHPSFEQNGFDPLTMASIYQMANAVVFPSETEGRGLPIIEASAIGVPIICSQYHPREVFDSVIGKGLPKELQLRYTLFPEITFSPRFLSKVANMLVNPEINQEDMIHNRKVVHARFSPTSLNEKFKELLTQLQTLG